MFGFKNECSHRAGGYRGAVPYVFMKGNTTDGIGRIHGDMYTTCIHCGKEFIFCRVHADRLIRQLMEHPVTRSQVMKIIDEFKEN